MPYLITLSAHYGLRGHTTTLRSSQYLTQTTLAFANEFSVREKNDDLDNEQLQRLFFDMTPVIRGFIGYTTFRTPRLSLQGLE